MTYNNLYYYGMNHGNCYNCAKAKDCDYKNKCNQNVGCINFEDKEYKNE